MTDQAAQTQAAPFQAGDFAVPGLEPVESLGGGLESTVWLAFDTRRHVPVVAKLLRPEHRESDHHRAVMAAEAAMLERLRHPGIVRILDADVDAETPWIVQEYVDGPSLSRLISRQGALSHHHVASIGLELASALVYLRHEGVAHLDIKPSNIVTGTPARLVDLGSALTIADAAVLDRPRGTDPYMAPEQIRPGELGTMSPASDVWAFGATMWRAATGHRAWPDTPRWLQLEQPPRTLPDHLPRPIADTLTRCIAADPQDRPDPVEIADVFADVLAELPGRRLSGFSFAL